MPNYVEACAEVLPVYLSRRLPSFQGYNSQRTMRKTPGEGRGTLGISGWGCAAGTLEPLAYTRASSAEFCYPILE